MENPKPINLKEILLITALTLIGALLRIYELDRPSSGDEERTFNRYGLLSWKLLLFLYDDTSQHRLFSVLSNFCLQLLGENEIVFRLPSFLARVLAVPLIYYLSRSLNNSRSVSFCSSCLLIFSQPHLTYSQAGR
jgi:predicted membrane-bound mannosyltransferase